MSAALRLSVSPIVLGAMARSRPEASLREDLVRQALDLGLTTIDTAPLYEMGDSERWVGRALRGQRDRAVVATKVGLRWDDAHGEVLFAFTDPEGRRTTVRKDSRPEAVRRDVEGSLSRLGIDCLDLVQVHHPDRHTPIEDTMGALLDLLREGKLRHVGISNFDLELSRRAQRALGEVGLTSTQMAYSLLDRSIERDVLPWAEREGVVVLAYSPLAEGVLAGRFARQRPSRSAEGLHHPRNALPATKRLREGIEPLAARRAVSTAVLALAWLRSRPGMVAPVVGVSSREQLDDVARALSLELDPSELEAIEDAFAGLRLDPAAGRRRRDLVGRLPGAAQRRAGAARRLVGRALSRLVRMPTNLS